jgi:hypothetical protein
LFNIPDDGVTVTLLAGGGFCVCTGEGADLLPLQPIKKVGIARIAQKKRLRCKGDLPEVDDLLRYTRLDTGPQAGNGSVPKVGLGK